ncbi:UDP-N-acetylmuramoyl-tripeptide--D-alanyl-D-alanine ligase [Ottowia testudinis]|uniref:UDP-N-acetylmuramoyl-tripeptide--D-alanyl-D-alanine ligase n=1 Tax=Ottowia testudinis TaxID=2816950 RepID=A0A975CIM5_9BURK|nr:UDP-N-acetylmuramoyl-tripeptide--D-alanyl-D-alanine ligase [Ottowia testudinis]QTD44879.1 UDP-N-acetylmuramoyl-tripeptide--D-alanyl-D-alanine ligase [Ottowia testudinis]
MSGMSGMNLLLGDIAPWLTGARLVGDAAVRCARVHTDTRTLQPGDLFVALRGERFDAAAFLSTAAEGGAAGVLCDETAEEQLLAAGLPGVLVPDARRALGELAHAWRQRFAGPLIAVTGSNGKTTVTQMIASILHAWKAEAALATQGNFNNDIGVPLTLLRLRPSTQVAVVELGMNHPGEIAQLAAMTQPTVALVNNAQREHQEFMASVQAVAEENGAVLAALGERGTAVFPAGDQYEKTWQRFSGKREQLLFGEQSGGAHVSLESAAWRAEHWQATARTPAGGLAFDLHAAGRHNLRNALAAIACAMAAGAPLAAIAQGLSAFRPVKGRSRTLLLRHRGRAITLVDDTYNANPDSVRAVIDVLAELPGPRLLVLGDMGEVGGQGPAFHAEVGAYARERGIERLLAHGPQAIHAAMAFGGGRHFDDMAALTDAVRTHLPQCGAIAVKGSRLMRMERVVDALSVPASGKAEGVHAA